MSLPENDLKMCARRLRNGMTDAEHSLWSRLRMKQIGGYQFYRQKVIGNYIADSYCHRAGLVIEVDGNNHYKPKKVEADRTRDEYMRGRGVTVLRFTNIDIIQNIAGVVERIEEKLTNLSGTNPSISPFEKGRGTEFQETNPTM
jgi:very-short-patch-repair endonuclease